MDSYLPRLIRLTAINKNVSITLVPLSPLSLTQKDLFVLETKSSILQWGAKPSFTEKNRCLFLTNALEQDRRTSNITITLDSIFTDSPQVDLFWTTLGATNPTERIIQDIESDIPPFHPQVIKINFIEEAVEGRDDEVKISFDYEILAEGYSLKKELFKSTDVILLDTGFEVIIWEGQKVKRDTLSREAAKFYIVKFKRPERTKISYCREGVESNLFRIFLV